jgi:hypothetical protein
MFETANHIEAGLWLLMGLGFAIAGLGRAGVTRRRCETAGAALVAFGASDIVEAQTGAWWRPWWLLAWKGLCLLVLCPLAIRWFQHRRAS